MQRSQNNKKGNSSNNLMTNAVRATNTGRREEPEDEKLEEIIPPI